MKRKKISTFIKKEYVHAYGSDNHKRMRELERIFGKEIRKCVYGKVTLSGAPGFEYMVDEA